MTFQIGLVLAILGIAVVLFITEKLRVDVVALLVLVLLALTKLVTPIEALSGFSNPAVITVWAVFILSGGLSRTGIAGLVGLQTRKIVRRVGSGDASGFARGTQVELEFDPDQYTGTGVFLFASVLEAFLGLYGSLNSFTQVVAKTRQREGALKRWTPRAGEIQLL